MTDSASNQSNSASNLLQREYYARIIAYLATAATIAAGTFMQHFSYEVLWMVPFALIYPHLAYMLGKQFNRENPRRHGQIMLMIDAVNSGIAIALLDFPAVPGLMLLSSLAFICMIIGGVRGMLVVLLVTCASALLTGLATGSSIRFATPVAVSIVSIFFSATFICLIAFFIYKQGLYLGATRIELKREQEKAARLARNLAKYLSPQVWESIFSGKKTVRLETQRKKLSVFFSDIRGFTELTEEMEAEALTELLNNYLNEMSKIALKFGGTIDKFIGDSVMVFFGDPNTQGAKKDAVAAVSMAIAMRKHMKVLRQQWRARGITKPLEIRMGINTGFCTVGNFGADTRMDYTIIGREVNLASRLESSAEAGEILISHETYSLIKDVIMCRDKGQATVKGFTRPVQVYQIVDFRRDLGATSSYLEHELPGFSMYLDTNSIQNFDKQRVIEALGQAAEQLRDKIIH